MSLEGLLAEYGYWLIFATTFIEGESIVVIAGVAAAAGHMSLPLIVIAAFCGSYLGDQLWFHVGRRYGPRLLQRYTWLEAPASRVFRLLERYDTGFILTFRFIYGVRNVTPFALGMSRISAVRFALLNFVAAGMWAITFAGAGYLFGQAITALIGDIKAYIGYVLLGLLLLALGLWVFKILFRRKRRKDKTTVKSAKGPKAPAQRQAPPVTRT